MIQIKRLGLAWLGVCLSLYGIGQESIDLVTLSLKSSNSQAYADTSAESVEGSFLANFKLPVVISPKSIWFSNITYTTYRVRPELTDVTFLNTISVQGLIIQTGLVQKIDDTRAFQLLFVPRYMKDLYGSSGDAWQFGGIALYEKRYSDQLRLRYGVMYNQELSGPLLVPLVDVLWNMGGKWSLTGLFPIYGKLNYQATERFTTGISHFGLITSYAISDPNYQGTYLERTSIDLSLFGRWQMFDKVFLEGRLGYALDRQYAQYPNDEQIGMRISILKINDDRNAQLNYALADAPFAEFRLVYNLPVNP